MTAAIAGLAALVAASALSYLYTEILWFDELGFRQVLFKSLYSRALLFVAGFGISAAFLYLNLAVAWRRRRGSPVMVVVGGELRPLQLPVRSTWYLALFSALVGLAIGSSFSSQWVAFQQFINQTPFGVRDPFYGRDVGFYVFSLPLNLFLYRVAGTLLAVTLLSVIVLYAFTGGISWSAGFSLTRNARAHLFSLGALAMLLKAYGYRLSMFNLLYSPRGVAFGASYTDINAQLPATKASLVAAVAGAGLLLVAAFSRGRPWRKAAVAVAMPVLTSLILGVAYPAFVQQFHVAPDEIAKEEPYIAHNIKYTTMAYGLDKLEEREYPVEMTLAYENVTANRETVRNIRLWDWRALRDTYAQLQEIRLYYRFNDVDVDRYRVGNELRQVYIAARELNKAGLAEAARTWVNLHLKFTHGYGVVMSSGSEVSAEGLPVFLIKDVPPKVEPSSGLKIVRPEIYFGELTTDYAVVNTKEEEFDYPVGDQPKYTRYQGRGGVQLSSALRRLAFALRTGSYKLMLSQSVTSESRVMFRRQITDRVRTVAPFLRYDQDPYIVLGSDGRLYWILDAYTVSSYYPYSEPYRGGFNYIRNSVKAVVDAYEGKVRFYVADPSDPLLLTYQKIFPGLFSPMSGMPADLKDHIRYPQDLFIVQSEMYATYHMKSPRVFYNREDMWAIPNEIYGSEPRRMEPYYIVMRVPGETRAEFLQMIPFTPTQKLNMVGWVAARCDAERYGELLAFKFPKDRVIYGPMQVEARIDQDPQISQQLTLWGQVGSQIIRGNLLVIPVDSSVIYAEPLYLQAKDTKFPEFKRVFVAYGDRVVMEQTVDAALRRVFGLEAVEGRDLLPGTPIEETGLRGMAERAAQLYREALERLRSGDWAGFGRLIEELGRALDLLRGAAEETQSAPPAGPVAPGG